VTAPAAAAAADGAAAAAAAANAAAVVDGLVGDPLLLLLLLVLLQVNKIRELPQHPEVLVTHTDAPELYVWNTATQPNMSRDKVS
jgi:hypothetical protein